MVFIILVMTPRIGISSVFSLSVTFVWNGCFLCGASSRLYVQVLAFFVATSLLARLMFCFEDHRVPVSVSFQLLYKGLNKYQSSIEVPYS